MEEIARVKPKVLIVDDVPANLVALRTVLQSSSIPLEVVEANSGSEALERIIEHDFALILLDAHMPEMDGFEVADIISSSEQFSKIPIIFITAAYKDLNHRIKGYQAGAVDYLQKPIEEDILISKVRTFLSLYEEREQLESLKKELEQRVEDRTHQLLRIQKTAKVGSWVIDPKGDSHYINIISQDILESLNENTNILQCMDAQEKLRVEQLIYDAALLEKDEIQFDFQFNDKQNNTKEIHAVANLVYQDHHLSQIEGSLQDISERKETEKQLQYLANHDALTGLPNRYLFKDRLQIALKAAERQDCNVAMLLLDLDNFKEVNDSLGHPVGDLLLKEIAIRLQDITRESDTVARLGGDEFAIILTDIEHLDSVSENAERCLDELSKPYSLDGHIIETSVSIGISVYPQDDDKPDELIKYSDLALYRSKNMGKNLYHFYDEEMGLVHQQQKKMKEELTHAIKVSQLEVYFQPLINVTSNQVIAAEALIRWNHPEKGFMSPAEFLPLAESTQLIIPLGLLVLKRVCQVIADTNKLGMKLRFAVNISPVQIQADSFIDDITTIIAEHNTPTNQLEFEITENVILNDTEKNNHVLEQVGKLGISIALDDFGTGYSSLTHLKNIPASTLKIDRSFIKNILDDPQDRYIVDVMIKLATQFNMKVVAEGVELKEQKDFLNQYENLLIQGFYFAKPMPIAEFIVWFNKYNKYYTF